MLIENAVPVKPAGGGSQPWRWVVGCLVGGLLVVVLGCCLLAGGVGAWLWSEDRHYPTDPASLMTVVEKEVAEMRGLDFKKSVNFQLMTREELGARMQKDLEADWSREEAEDYALVLEAFDLVEPGTDLFQLYVDLYTDQVAGFYDPETEELYVISDKGPMNVIDRITLVHELTHALQDQHYDLEALGYGDDVDVGDNDHMIGIQALVEGDATLLQSNYMEQMTPIDRVRLIVEFLQMDIPSMDDFPAVVRVGMEFPYEEGLIFAQRIYADGEWTAVNAAYRDLPQSSEQIMHPLSYMNRDEPQLLSLPPLTETLGSGWRLTDEDVMGELTIDLQMGEAFTTTGHTAAAGWDGDRYAVYYQKESGDLAFIWRTVWDRERDAQEFERVYGKFLTLKEMDKADPAVEGWSCWEKASDYRCLLRSDDSVVVVRAPDVETVRRIIEKLNRE